MPRKTKPKIEEVAKKFGEQDAIEAAAATEKAKLRKQFFDLIEIPEEELAQQVIFYEGDDPERHVATLFPKWKLIDKKLVDEFPAEWKLILQEDPDKKTYVFINPLDQKVYQKLVKESAPGVDMERLEKEDPHLWAKITFQPPPPPRQLKPLEELKDDEKEALMSFLTEPKLQIAMQKPRKAKPEELETLG